MAAALTCPKCKKVLRTANPLPAGKKVKCPSCQALFVVPAAKGAAPAETGIKKPDKAPPKKAPAKAPPAPAPKGKAPPPVKTPRRSAPEPEDDFEDADDVADDYDEDEDERPSRRGKKKSGSMVFVLAGVLLLLVALGAVGAFVWPGFLKSPAAAPVTVVPQPPSADANNPPQQPPVDPPPQQPPVVNLPLPKASSNPLLAYLPGDSLFAAGLRINAPILKKILDHGIKEAAAKGFGELPEPEVVVAAGNTNHGAIVIQTLKPYDKEKIRISMKLKDVPGRNFYASPQDDGFLGMPSDRILVFGGGRWTEAEFADLLSSTQTRLDAELVAQIGAIESATIWGVAANKGEFNKGLNDGLNQAPIDMVDQQVAGAKNAVPAVQKAKFVRAVADFPAGAGLKLAVTVVCGDAKDAKTLSDLANDAWAKQGKGGLYLLSGLAMQQVKADLTGLINDIANSMQITAQAEVFSAGLQISDKSLKVLEDIPLPSMSIGPSTTQVRNNLRDIGLAMHSYHDVFKKLPPHASYSPDGKPLLSWRVHILPFLEQDHLYRQFKLDAPWDDPDNLKLLTMMPKIYEIPGRTAAPGETFLQVFVADAGEPKASSPPFKADKNFKMSLLDMTDGTSNTILATEAGKAVPWTKPQDIPYSAKQPVPPLGIQAATEFLVLMADGASFVAKRKLDEQTLRRAIGAADGLPLPPGWQEGAAAEPLPVPPKNDAANPPPKIEPEAKIEPPAPEGVARSPLPHFPADSESLVGIDLDRIRADPLTAPLMDTFREQAEKTDAGAWAFLQNCRYACVAASADGAKWVGFLRMKNPVTEESLQKGLGMLSPKSILGYQTVEMKGDKAFLWQIDERQLLIGKTSEEEFTELMLSADPRISADLQKHYSKLNRSPLWLVAANKGAVNMGLDILQPTQPGSPPEAAVALAALQGAKAFMLWCQPHQGKLQINAGLTASNKADADKLQAQLDDIWKTKGKTFLGFANLALPKDSGLKLASLLSDVTDSLTIQAEEDLVFAALQLSKGSLDELRQAAEAAPITPSSIPSLLPEAGSTDTQTAAEMKLLQGKWKVATVEVFGQQQPVAPAMAPTISISGSRLSGLNQFVFTIKADPTKEPKWLDLSITQGKKTSTIPGIYSVTEDELRLCIPVGNFIRPLDFDTQGRQVQLYTAERVKN